MCPCLASLLPCRVALRSHYVRHFAKDALGSAMRVDAEAYAANVRWWCRGRRVATMKGSAEAQPLPAVRVARNGKFKVGHGRVPRYSDVRYEWRFSSATKCADGDAMFVCSAGLASAQPPTASVCINRRVFTALFYYSIATVIWPICVSPTIM